MKPFSIKSLLTIVLIVLGLLSSALGVIPARAAGPLYVMPGVTGDCSSWANACDLQTALATAISGDEIWVAAGVYKPTTNPAEREATFQLKEGVAAYGGFAGIETARDQRDIAVNSTILSGDIDNNDTQSPIINDLPTVVGNNKNSYHVVTGANGAILDGFTITAGYANVGVGDQARGAGMFNDSGSSPAISNVTFIGNWANINGGGMFNNNSSNPTLTNVKFNGNFAGSGGGMTNSNGSSPALVNIIFSRNTANNYGGGMAHFSSSHSVLENVTFQNNSAYWGGGMYNPGNSTLTNVTFVGNSANSNGGGMLSGNNSTLTNVTFSGNSAKIGRGGGVYAGALQIRNTIFWGNTAAIGGSQIYGNSVSISDSVVQGGYAGGTNIITTDPLLGALGNYGGFTRTIPLLTGSSAIDTGNDAVCPDADQRSVSRPQGSHCDIGAYEYTDTVVLDTQIDTQPRNPSYIKSASFTFSGSSSAGGAVIFECSLDGAAFADCVSPQGYTGLTNGSHTFAVRAKDSLGNLDLTPASYTWTTIFQVAILYVTSDGTGDCSSWVNACTLQTALTNAIGGNELWVKAGMHKPTANPADREATFRLKEGVAVYGGFAGTENTREQRDSSVNLTVLSGDIDNNDSQTPVITNLTTVTGNTKNSYHVVTGATAATIDGVTITAGYANGSTGCPGKGCGGGVYNLGSSPTLSNITFSGNQAYSYGGGMANNSSSHPILENVAFQNNRANNGGGLYDDSGNSTFMNITFVGNLADNGGGLYSTSSPTLTNVTFTGNSAYSNGGGLYSASGPTLTNVTFVDNYAWIGGGLYAAQETSQIRNSIFWGNKATHSGAQIYSSLISISESVVEGGYAGGTNIITADPLLGTLGNYGGFTRTIPLLTGSSAIDTGNDAVCPDADQRSVSRPQGSHCDIGAYEYTDTVVLDTQIDTQPRNPSYTAESSFAFSGLSSTGGAVTFECSLNGAAFADCVSPQEYTGLTNGSHTFLVRAKDSLGNLDLTPASYTWTTIFQVAIFYVTSDGTGDCSSWVNACTLQTALTNASGGYEIWVAAGVYKPATNSADRGATFRLKEGVAVYGGFAGTESSREQRNFVKNLTVLSGDIDNDDSQKPIITDIETVTGIFTNSYHVVTGATDATLDGFTITAGSAYGSPPNDCGGGMYNPTSTSPILTNIIFAGNAAYIWGGGLCNNGGNPILTNIIFDGNRADASTGFGGGLANRSSNPILTNITFSNNSAHSGGGVYNYGYEVSNPIFTNVTFHNNSADYGGGVYNSGANGRPTFVNVTLSENSASYDGGGIYSSLGYPIIKNTIFWGNTAVGNGAQLYGSIQLTDSIVQGGYPGGENIISADPRLGTLGYYDSFTPTIPVLNGSSAIDTANDAICPNVDQRGVERPQGSHCDIGAYEYTDTLILSTQINDRPASSSPYTWANFAFSGSSNMGGAVIFECSLDGAAYTTCTSPHSYTELTAGFHTFSVRARDLSGNLDATPASYFWQVKGPQVYYSTPSGTGNCSSWANACSLQTALTLAVAGSDDEIWVAAGTHKPTPGTDREATFQLKEGVAIYGGFVGTEDIREQRNFVANETILSGDLLGNDNNNVEYDEPTRADNSYHVVTGADNAILDGFTITAGNSTAYTDHTSGGGMYNLSSSPTLTNIIFRHNSALGRGGGMANFTNSNPTLSNVKFDTNSADSDGGGIYNYSSGPSLIDVTFHENSAGYYGGGMFSDNYYNPTHPILINVTFSNNSAVRGGGMYNNSSSPSLTNITFTGNSAVEIGGGINNSNSANPTLTNITFSNNSAGINGGGIHNFISSPVVMNTIFWGNTAPYGGAQIYNFSGSPGAAIVSDSIVQGGYPGGTNIITADPKLGALGDYGGSTQILPILDGSSAINTANDTTCPATDQRGIVRPQGFGCDIGAFEYVIPFDAFEKLGPTDAEASVSLSPTLSWQTSSGATSYEYCYSSAPGPCTKWNSVGANTSVTLSGLAPGYTYYWQARAVNTYGTAEADNGTWWSGAEQQRE